MFERVVDHLLPHVARVVGQHGVVLIGIDHHVVAFAGPVERPGELGRMLEMDVVVGHAVDQQQPGAPVVEQPREADRRIVIVAGSVVLRQVVVDLGIDGVVVAPRRDGGHGDSHLEEPEPLQSTARGHEPAERPPVDADAPGVDPRLRSHVAGERQLVLDLQGSQPAVGLLLELLAAESGAAAVGRSNDVALVDQRILPIERPAVGDGLRTGTGILGEEHWVALRGVEIARTHHVGIERVAALGDEREELLDRTARSRQFALEFGADGQRTHGAPLAGTYLDAVGRSGRREGGDVIFHPLAGNDGVVALACSEAALVLAVERHAVEVAPQRRRLGGEEPHAFGSDADDLGDFPVAFGDLSQRTAADAVEIEVHEPGEALLADQEPVLVDEGDGAVVDALDILLRALLVDGALGAVRLAEDHFEGVLPAVDAVVPQAAVGREADAGKVLIGLGAGVDALGPARIEVDDEELHDGIGIAGLGILERKGLVVKLAVEAHHLHHGHVALVETQVGDAAAVGRKGVGPREVEDIGVHLEDEDVAGHLQLGLELAAVAVLDPHAAVELAVESVVEFRRHFEKHLLQQVEGGESVVEDLLFEARLADHGFENPRTERRGFHEFGIRHS